ncbi:MAG: preprotein translocase subunit YajC [Bacteroidota bacterium]|jgi:preprotein translocase subunit YajC|nr:preprotein translocase subunit YajC [Flavobacteriia bacterium]NBP28308.1 preprotein translocase subunit YajC [Flavobacteriia bacterium]
MQSGNPMSSLIMIALMLIIFYFFMIRPQAKKQKELRKFREGLKPGDKVITSGGIHGKILELTDTTVLINSEGSKIRVEISHVVQSPEDAVSAITK